MKKRFISLLLALIVFVSAVTVPYYETKAFDIPTAFWGTLEYSRAFWTALNTGGALEGGVSLSSFEVSSRQDLQDFQTQILIAYHAFCIYKEKARLIAEDLGLTESEIDAQAEASGSAMAQRFQDNAINVNNTTGHITVKDYGYWREFCKKITSVAKNGLGGSIGTGSITPHFSVKTGSNINITSAGLTNSGENTITYNGKYYLYKGKCEWDNSVGPDFEFSNVPNDRVRLPFVSVYLDSRNRVVFSILFIDVNRLTGQYIADSSSNTWLGSNNANDLNRICNDIHSMTNFVQYFTNGHLEEVIDWAKNYEQNLSVSSGGSTVAYEEDISNALDSTEVGKAIKAGGVEKADIVKEGAIPVKRNSLAVDDNIASGVVGWDIPDARTLENSIAYPQNDIDERKATGIISVPKDEVEGATDDSTAITWPREAVIDVPEEEEEDEETTVDDLLDVQGGEFYPSQVDITEFFPFCIPFDIAYCVNKFHVAAGSAPIIHIPIVYPRALHSVLGESYDVVIDFNEYIVLRNVIRYFILLLFIIGLIQVTRNLIRG